MATVRQIKRQGAALITAKGLNRLFRLTRDVLLAAAFGGSAQISSFMIAYNLINIPQAIFGEGAITSSFVPRFEKLRLKSEFRAYFFLRDLLGAVAVVNVLLVGLVEAVLLPLYFFVPFPPVVHQVVGLVAAMAPAFIFMTISKLQAAYLGCEQRFFLAGVAPVIFNVVWVIAILFLWDARPDVAIYVMAFVVLLGYILIWLVTVGPTLKRIQSHLGRQVWQKISLFGRDVRAIGKPFIYSMIGYGSLQINLSIDPIFARIASPSGPAYLWYAETVASTAFTVFGLGFAGVLLPALSRAVKRREWGAYRRLLFFADKRIVTMMIPWTFGLLAVGFSLVSLLYGRGRFTSVDGVVTTYCLWVYALGLVPQTLIIVQTAAFFAHHTYHTPAMLTLLSVGSNVVLNELFVVGLGLGPVAVASATTISLVVQSFFLYRGLTSRGQGVRFSGAWPLIGKCALAGLIAWIACMAIDWWLFSGTLLRALTLTRDLPMSRLFRVQLVHFLVLSAVFCVVLYLSGLLFGIKEWRIGRGKHSGNGETSS